MNLPQGKRGQGLAVGLLLIPLVLFYLHLVKPAVSRYVTLQDSLEDSYFQWLRYQRIAQALPELQKQHSAVSALDPLTPYLLAGQNRSLAAANLQAHIQELSLQQNGRIMSTRVLPYKLDDQLERVVLDVRLQTHIEGIQQILYQLETQTPYVFIEEITISSKQYQQTANSLDVHMVVYSLRQLDKEDPHG